MRIAKFMLALLFGAAVLITFLKLLFFAVMAAAVFGTLFMVFRAGRYMGRGGVAPAHYYPHSGHPAWRSPYQSAQPLDPRGFAPREKNAFSRHIEVL